MKQIYNVMLDAGSDGCSRSLVPSVGGWLTDLSAAGAVIPTAVTVPRFFFFLPWWYDFQPQFQ